MHTQTPFCHRQCAAHTFTHTHTDSPTAPLFEQKGKSFPADIACCTTDLSLLTLTSTHTPVVRNQVALPNTHAHATSGKPLHTDSRVLWLSCLKSLGCLQPTCSANTRGVLTPHTYISYNCKHGSVSPADPPAYLLLPLCSHSSLVFSQPAARTHCCAVVLLGERPHQL